MKKKKIYIKRLGLGNEDDKVVATVAFIVAIIHRSVRSDILSGAIAGGRPRTFLIHLCSGSTGRTRCHYQGFERQSIADSDSWT